MGGYGMPSSHSQFMAFFSVAFVYLLNLRFRRNKGKAKMISSRAKALQSIGAALGQVKGFLIGKSYLSE
jgi:membrane-associated phospholipid phosphatase